MNLVLIGFMGTGKTTVGKRVAQCLNMAFEDTDDEVQKVTGLTIKELFDKYGEIRFRSEETAAIRRIVRQDNQVIATGGGAVLDPENISALQKNGMIICLKAQPEVIYERVKHRNTRPLLEGENLMDKINRLLWERRDLYKKARFTIDTSQNCAENVVEEIIHLYTKEVNNHGNS